MKRINEILTKVDDLEGQQIESQVAKAEITKMKDELKTEKSRSISTDQDLQSKKGRISFLEGEIHKLEIIVERFNEALNDFFNQLDPDINIIDQPTWEFIFYHSDKSIHINGKAGGKTRIIIKVQY